MTEVNELDTFGAHTGAEVAVDQMLEKEYDRGLEEFDDVV